jgi:hypothetical protein
MQSKYNKDGVSINNSFNTPPKKLKATRKPVGKPVALAPPQQRIHVMLTQLELAKIIFALCTEPDSDKLMAQLGVELAQTIIDEDNARSFK